MRDLKYYVLIERRVVAIDDLIQWGKWMTLSRVDHSSRVAETTIGDYWVSTVFLGLDHRFSGDGPPIVFETMAFSQKGDHASDETMQRYCTFEEAERGHNALVEMLRVLEADAQEITRATLAIMKVGLSEHMKKGKR